MGTKDQADPPVPEGVPGRRSTGRGEGRLSFPRIAFQPLCQAGAAGTLMVQGQSQPLKGRGCIMRGWAGLGRQKPHLLNIYRPPLRRGTFNPLFDGRPRKYFFHILNLLAPVNHLNLLPLRTHTPMSFPSLAAVKDAGTLFAPAFTGERTAINYLLHLPAVPQVGQQQPTPCAEAPSK